MSNQVIKEDGQKSFDHRVHIRHPKSGIVTKKQPYRLVIDKEQGEIYYRGNVAFYRNGEPVAKAKTV